MPLFGRVTAAATSSRGAAAASVAHQFADHLVAIEEGVADIVAADAAAADSERVTEARGVAEEARSKGAARAKEAVESHLEALLMEPTRKRHVSMAAAVLAHASLASKKGGLEQWRGAVSAAEAWPSFHTRRFRSTQGFC